MKTYRIEIRPNGHGDGIICSVYDEHGHTVTGWETGEGCGMTVDRLPEYVRHYLIQDETDA